MAKTQKLECGPMPNVMAALPNIGGALCESSVIPFLAPRRKLRLTPTARVPCSNADNIGERKTQSEFCSWQNSVTWQEPPKTYYIVYQTRRRPNVAQSLVSVRWATSVHCSAVTNLRRETRWNLLGCPKLVNRSQPLMGLSSAYCEDTWRRYCRLTGFSDCRHMP